MSLVLEVEFLLGVAFIAKHPATDEPDWPPQPDRVFSALVAAWAARGEHAEEHAALEWLEAEDPPRILAGPAHPRPAPKAYVPPNDDKSGNKGNIRLLPDHRSRQERRFPAAILSDPIVKYIWPNSAADEATLAALECLARDVAYVGHSSSLTRCRFFQSAATEPLGGARHAARRIYPGRLKELCAGFASRPIRRPTAGTPVLHEPEPSTQLQSVFGEQWIVLEHIDGPIPDLRACAVVAKRLRDALMSGFPRELIPEIVSGHSADGMPSHASHLAIVPMSFVGFDHADGGIHGFALVLPRDHERTMQEIRTGARNIQTDAAREIDRVFRASLGKITKQDVARDRRIFSLYGNGRSSADAPSSAEITFALGGAGSGKASLRAERYIGPARVWMTATPIVLDRHLRTPSRAKTRGDGDAYAREVADLIADACENIGLPRPLRVVSDKHSAIEGAPSSRPSGAAPHWTNWRVPEAFRTRHLAHATIEFAEPVQGPLILGAARFVGLGLCLPRNPVAAQ